MPKRFQWLAFFLLGALIATSATAAPPEAVPKVRLKEAGGDSVTFSHDSKYLVTTSADAARLWDTATFQPVGDVLPYCGSDRVNWSTGSVSFSPDSRQLVLTNGADARVFETASGKLLGVLNHQLPAPSTQPARRTAFPNGVWAAAFSHDGMHIATGGSDRRVTIWNAKTLQSERQIRCPEAVGSVEFSLVGDLLLAAAPDTHVFDLKTGRPLSEEPLPGHYGRPRFSPDARRVVVRYGDSVGVYDVRTGANVYGTFSERKLSADAASFGRDSDTVVVALDNRAELWNMSNVARTDEVAVTKLENPLVPNDVVNATFSPDGAHVLTCTRSDVVGRQSLGTGIWTVRNAELVLNLRQIEIAKAGAFSADGRYVAIACGSRDGKVQYTAVYAMPRKD